MAVAVALQLRMMDLGEFDVVEENDTARSHQEPTGVHDLVPLGGHLSRKALERFVTPAKPTQHWIRMVYRTLYLCPSN
ncbi:uncharacterized protein PgNI_02534 [Pyricularia grisea]|uniref:Uncharacterized protein n=1 Tax=Pyricularia grisea TaxID=148305 RepID=A0A6P8BFY8_PYRGI|nr:uncharacterized protein PgNI_02534 [Pyricularia grisea]TLD15534.1 hypothetical protein PgNI_02534 [Pyricularia grisea]